MSLAIFVFDEIEISDNETTGSLYQKLKDQSPLSLKSLIEKIKNNSLEYSAQDESKVSFAPTLKKQDGFLDFKNQTYAQIKRITVV